MINKNSPTPDKGQSERFRDVLTLEQLTAANEAFGGYMQKMWYTPYDL